MEEMFITIEDEFITLGQLLKTADIISSGGMAKWYLSEFDVFVNELQEQRRGKKLYDGDVVYLPNEEVTITINSASDSKRP